MKNNVFLLHSKKNLYSSLYIFGLRSNKMNEIPKTKKSIIRWFKPTYRTQEEWQSAYKNLSEQNNFLSKKLNDSKSEYSTLLLRFDEYKVKSICEIEDLQKELIVRDDTLKKALSFEKELCSQYEKTIDHLVEKIGKDNTEIKKLMREKDKTYQKLAKLQKKMVWIKKDLIEGLKNHT